MKKLAKYLVLFLVIAALVGVFAFAASADNAQGTTDVVGSYDAPDGAWAPSGDYATISYGAWATETDYLTGADPAVWYSTDSASTKAEGQGSYSITLVPPASGYGYVHVFTDSLKVDAQYRNLSVQTLNLGGHTLNTSAAFSSTNAALTVKNGKWNFKALIQGEKDLIIENVHITQSSTTVVYGFYGNLTVKDSIIDWNSNSLSGDAFRGAFFLDTYKETIVDVWEAIIDKVYDTFGI